MKHAISNSALNTMLGLSFIREFSEFHQHPHNTSIKDGIYSFKMGSLLNWTDWRISY